MKYNKTKFFKLTDNYEAIRITPLEAAETLLKLANEIGGNGNRFKRIVWGHEPDIKGNLYVGKLRLEFLFGRGSVVIHPDSFGHRTTEHFDMGRHSTIDEVENSIIDCVMGFFEIEPDRGLCAKAGLIYMVGDDNDDDSPRGWLKDREVVFDSVPNYNHLLPFFEDQLDEDGLKLLAKVREEQRAKENKRKDLHC